MIEPQPPELERQGVDLLVVDDDEDARDMLAALAERAGYSVKTASNGLEALHILEQTRPSVILLDVCMPVMDGATFRQEQRRNRDWVRIPTVVVTGAAEEPTLDVGVVAALRKPLRARDLLAMLARFCPRDAAS